MLFLGGAGVGREYCEKEFWLHEDAWAKVGFTDERLCRALERAEAIFAYEASDDLIIAYIGKASAVRALAFAVALPELVAYAELARKVLGKTDEG